MSIQVTVVSDVYETVYPCNIYTSKKFAKVMRC